MAGTSTERVRITGSSGSQVASVDAKGIKYGLATYLLDESGNQISSLEGQSYTILTTDLPADTSNIEYVGWAVAGSNTAEGKAAAIWKIGKLSYTAGMNPIMGWADGVTTFTKVWDDKATYNYS